MVRGVRKTGELIAELPRSGGGRPKGNGKTGDTDVGSFCKAAAISDRSARRWQGVADIPEKKFEAAIRAVLDDDDTLAMWRKEITPPKHVHHGDTDVISIKPKHGTDRAYLLARLTNLTK
ncbi:MAG: hypothetical protein FWD12_08670 [Alphaproteobacteria bacterium]|nr:hypothetical protein [Alphaproteobacteria bacterium]